MPRFVHFLYFIPLALTAVISLKAFRQSWPRAFQLFSIFIIGSLLLEIFSISWKLWIYKTPWWEYSQNNLWIYNLSYTPCYLFYFLFYYRALDAGIIKRSTFFAISSSFIVVSISNLIFFQGLFKLDTYTIITGNLGILFFSLHYFKQELQKKVPVKVIKEPLFWISLGAFIFHTGSLPYFVCINHLSNNNMTLAVALFNILLVLNFFLQTSYLIAFLCRTPYQKKFI